MSENIKWNQFFLPNTALYDVKLPDSVVNRLWGYIHKSRKGAKREARPTTPADLRVC